MTFIPPPAELYILPPGGSTPPTAADLDAAIPVAGYVSTDGITTPTAAESTVTTFEQSVQLVADLSAVSYDHILRVLNDLADAIRKHEHTIREAHAAIDAIKAGPDHPRGRDAQTSPYDIGRRR